MCADSCNRVLLVKDGNWLNLMLAFLSLFECSIIKLRKLQMLNDNDVNDSMCLNIAAAHKRVEEWWYQIRPPTQLLNVGCAGVCLRLSVPKCHNQY